MDARWQGADLELDHIIREFLLETSEHLDRLDDLLRFDAEPSPAVLSSILRSWHSIKGTSGCLGFDRIESFAHAAEGVLSRLQRGEEPAGTAALLELVDATRRQLMEIEGAGPHGSHGSRRTHATRRGAVRVEVHLLDSVTGLVGELDVLREQVARHAGHCGDVELQCTAHRLDAVLAELREDVLRTRMQPLDTIWSKLPRLVHDLSHQLGKSVRLRMEGGQTQLDTTILAWVKDPLTHLVRNAVDHGFELPEQRSKLGKPVEGTLTLRAHLQGDELILEVADDGAGIDPALLRREAVARGMLALEAADRMGDREALWLAFAPGFTTAPALTHVSGRGVGLDVVRANVDCVGGRIDVRSVRGEGTTFAMRIPLVAQEVATAAPPGRLLQG